MDRYLLFLRGNTINYLAFHRLTKIMQLLNHYHRTPWTNFRSLAFVNQQRQGGR